MGSCYQPCGHRGKVVPKKMKVLFCLSLLFSALSVLAYPYEYSSAPPLPGGGGEESVTYDCKTYTGETCKFPFSYAGFEFDKCTDYKSENGNPYCLTTTNQYLDCDFLHNYGANGCGVLDWSGGWVA